VRPASNRSDRELASLAQETRRVAESITEHAIRARLIEISEEMLNLASPVQNSD
jgi:hypothetical protein